LPFVVEGDHHLAMAGVFLHRTVAMPPEDGVRVRVEAAFVAHCAEAQWVSEHLDGMCRSLPEAELLSLVRFAGLPEPEVNAPLELGDGGVVTPDLWFAAWRRVVEYEGSQHQEDRDQYTGDIDRYAAYRRGGVGYEQITKELMRSPRATVRRVHRLLVEGGYDGPVPESGDLWATLFRRLSDVVRPRTPSRQR
jgi:hypothetical protein